MRVTTKEMAEDDSEAGQQAEGLGEIALAVRKRVKRLMWERVGILRSRASISRALWEFEQIARAPLRPSSRNFLTVAMMIARAALWREESRGAHYRTDFPRRDDERWRVHSIMRHGAETTGSERIDFGEVVGTKTDGTVQTNA